MAMQPSKILECAICLDTARAPIRLCVEGHGCCGSCIGDLGITKCPHCRGPMANAKRVVQLEQLVEALHDQLKVACCHVGCKYKMLQKELEAHQAECKFRMFSCEGANFCSWDCKWKGRYDGILEHFKRSHPANCCMQFTTVSTMKVNFGSNFVDLQMISFKDGKQLFFYKHKLDCAAKKAYWIFQLVGPKYYAKFYKYEFEIMHGDVRKFKVTDYCVSDSIDAEEIFKDERCVVMSFQMLKNYLNEDGELKFRYRIMHNSPTT